MENSKWFKDAIIYQIYPRSFKDSNGDGIGDIKGIIEKLDYLAYLGINCVWLSPVYESPMDDNGYDIADYKKIHEMFGSMDDFKLMLDEMHKRGIRLIMDLVANHTSDEHEWFIESKKSKDNPYRDYYIWKEKPNNWTGFFGQKAWEYDKTTNEYYLHLFGTKQPDVNWENPKIREAYKDIMKFYLDMGVDGFRCDVINLISKDQRFKNGHNPLILVGKKYFINGPKIHEYLNELNVDVLSNYDCMTVGETVFSNLDDIKKFTDLDRKELSMVFNFDHTSVDNFLGVKWLMRKFSLKRFKKTLDKYQYGLATVGWNSLFYENDQRRSVGRFNTCDKEYRKESAKLLATTMYFLKGTPFIYQGQEIGMTNMDVNSLDEYVDIETHDVLKTMKKLHLPKSYIKKSIMNGSRDNSRTPMQWDDSEFAGFSNTKPWLKVNANKKDINVAKELEDKDSIFNYYKKLINIYKSESILVRDGLYKDLCPNNSKIFAYERRLDNEVLLVVSNFSKKEIKNKYHSDKYAVLISNYEDVNNVLKPYQTIMYKIKL